MPEGFGAFRAVDPEAEIARLVAQRAGTPQDPERECVLRRGHCFERTGTVLASDPPQYPEVCKHCGKRRVAVPREPWDYRDA